MSARARGKRRTIRTAPPPLDVDGAVKAAFATTTVTYHGCAHCDAPWPDVHRARGSYRTCPRCGAGGMSVRITRPLHEAES